MKTCIKFKDRLIGNMFKKNIIDMCFPKCNSIHTFFMLNPIDVYMTDKNNISRTVSLEEINNITKNIKYTCGTFNVPYYNHHRNQHCFIDGDDVNIGKVNKKPRITGTGSLHIFPTVPEGKIPPPLGKKIIQPIKFV